MFRLSFKLQQFLCNKSNKLSLVLRYRVETLFKFKDVLIFMKPTIRDVQTNKVTHYCSDIFGGKDGILKNTPLNVHHLKHREKINSAR